MDNYGVIYKELLELVGRGKRKFIIYPTGRNGALTDMILRSRFGIEDAIKVDNFLSKINKAIYKPTELERNLTEEYTWLITSESYSLTKELLDSIEPLNISSDKICVIFHSSNQKWDKEPTIQYGYGEEYQLLSQIGTAANSYPAYEFIETIRKKKLEQRIISVAEIGIDVGATAVEACKLLETADNYYLFDFQDIVDMLKEDLSKVPGICCNIKACGNSHRVFDSYCYTLCDILFDMRNKGLNGIFDVAYLDGLHGFSHDGLALCLLKELMKPEGYLVIDDINWTYQDESLSQSAREETSKWWSDSQLCEAQVRRAVNAFMINDKSFEEIVLGNLNDSRRIIYKKRS